MFFGFFRGAAVGERPRNDGLVVGDGCVHEEVSEIDQHVDGSRAVAVEFIKRIENSFQLVASPDVVVVVPGVWASGEDVHLEACNNAKVVACTLHPPEQIAMGVFINANGSAVGQHNIELEEIVADHAVQTFKGPMATPKTRAHHANAITGAGSGHISLIPKISHGLTVVYTTSKPGRFTTVLNADVPEFCHVDLNAVEGSKAFGITVATVYGQKLEAVFIAVFNLESAISQQNPVNDNAKCLQWLQYQTPC